MRIVIIIMLLFFASTAYCEVEPLEQLVLGIKDQQSTDLLEKLVLISQNQLLELRVHRILKTHKVKRPEYYAKLIAHSKYSVSEKKIATALLIPESLGDANATSYAGAQGAWQVMPRWKKVLKISGSLYHPPTCLDAMVKVWRIHLNDSKGNTTNALVAFSGRTPNYPEKVFKILRTL